jgi:hypothetical protein
MTEQSANREGQYSMSRLGVIEVEETGAEVAAAISATAVTVAVIVAGAAPSAAREEAILAAIEAELSVIARGWFWKKVAACASGVKELSPFLHDMR